MSLPVFQPGTSAIAVLKHGDIRTGKVLFSDEKTVMIEDAEGERYHFSPSVVEEISEAIEEGALVVFRGAVPQRAFRVLALCPGLENWAWVRAAYPLPDDYPMTTRVQALRVIDADEVVES